MFPAEDRGDLNPVYEMLAQVNRDDMAAAKVQRRLGGQELVGVGHFLWPVSYLATAGVGGTAIVLQIGDRFTGIASVLDPITGAPIEWEDVDYEVQDVRRQGSLPRSGAGVGAALFLYTPLIQTPDGNVRR